MQPERAVARINFQPHFDSGTRHVAYPAIGIHPGMVGRKSVDCSSRVEPRNSQRNANHHPDNHQ
jgi:hypothetical protein